MERSDNPDQEPSATPLPASRRLAIIAQGGGRRFDGPGVTALWTF